MAALVALFDVPAALATTTSPALSVGDFSVTEGNSGTTNATFKMTLSAKANTNVTVSYATREGTAKNNSDFVPTSGTLSIAKGQTSATKTVAIKGDTTPESTEYFYVDLSKNSSGTAISRKTATGTIYDNDPKADLSIALKDTPDPVAANGNIAYGVTVKNNGPTTAAGVRFTDYLPSAVQFVSAPDCTYSSSTRIVTCYSKAANNELPNGQTLTRTITVKAPASGTVANSATVTSNTYDPTSANNTATEATTVKSVNNTPTADLSIAVNAPVGPLVTGSDINYELVVKNNGPSTAQNVAVADPLPTDTTFKFIQPPNGYTCSTPPIGSHGTINCFNPSVASGVEGIITVGVSANSADDETITNVATVSSATKDPSLVNNTATAATTATLPAKASDLNARLDASVNSPAVGQAYSYQLTVGNAGPDNAPNTKFTFQLPEGVDFDQQYPDTHNQFTATCSDPDSSRTITCTTAHFPVGFTFVQNVLVSVRSDTPGGANLTASLKVTSDATDPSPFNNQVDDSQTVALDADVAVALTASTSTVSLGDSFRYDLVVTNNGPGDAGTVQATITFPDEVSRTGGYYTSDNNVAYSCSSPPLAPNVLTCTFDLPTTGTFHPYFNVAVNAETPSGTELKATASAYAGPHDQDEGNNSASASATVVAAN